MLKLLLQSFRNKIISKIISKGKSVISAGKNPGAVLTLGVLNSGIQEQGCEFFFQWLYMFFVGNDFGIYSIGN